MSSTNEPRAGRLGERRLLTVTGADRPGLIAAVSHALADAGTDIEDVSMTRLSGNFAMMLLARGGAPDRLRAGLVAAAAGADVHIHIDEAVEDAPQSDSNCYISAIGPNRIGIVAAISGVLARHGVNITEMTTRLLEKTQVPVYLVRLEAAFPRDAAGVEAELRRTATDLGIELRFEPIEQAEL